MPRGSGASPGFLVTGGGAEASCLRGGEEDAELRMVKLVASIVCWEEGLHPCILTSDSCFYHLHTGLHILGLRAHEIQGKTCPLAGGHGLQTLWVASWLRLGPGHQVMAIPAVSEHQAALPSWDLAAQPDMLPREMHSSIL